MSDYNNISNVKDSYIIIIYVSVVVLQAAQEKEELQREGDELDAKIRKAEKEIRALENTLRLMNSRNETYRKSFNRVTDTSECEVVGLQYIIWGLFQVFCCGQGNY